MTFLSFVVEAGFWMRETRQCKFLITIHSYFQVLKEPLAQGGEAGGSFFSVGFCNGTLAGWLGSQQYTSFAQPVCMGSRK